MRHQLKIDSKYWYRINEGLKTFEVRLNDRDYQVGDEIEFNVFVSEPNGSGDWIDDVPKKIIYIHSGLGLKEGYVILGIENIHQHKHLLEGENKEKK